MVKQLKKVGNGNALFLEKALLELVGLEEGGEVQVTVSDGSIIITPTFPRPVAEERLDAALERVVSKRGEVLRKLAQ